jgi:hypothetical protein
VFLYNFNPKETSGIFIGMKNAQYSKQKTSSEDKGNLEA